ncbi:WD40 repeat domain-containing serine/threonine protein kinase [Nonomuraea sp. NPDC000554]|uniref:WD40 repeat domain-containing serine/threonine protein kinase n=1 Tax=Nonomuraea sp. NPDC000554 TaxID=3154259 RepID=UPI0033192B23
MTPLTPSDPHRLGRYWLAGRLGAGGQGVVYEAYGPAGERVAVKVPRFDDTQSRARLAKEAAAAERVASFCTAKVLEARVEVAEPYIVSEFVPGPNLRQVITEGGPYEGDTLRRLAIGVATALTAIHQAGIVHRDLKPDNIILGPDGPRVIDFGVAREVGPTTTGPVMGTPNYMAPEVFTGRGATGAADLWAWALVVLFAARGADAIEAGEPMAVATSVLGFRPDTAGLPEPLGALVASALAGDPAERPVARDVLLGLIGDGGDPLSRGGELAGPLTGTAEPDLGAIAEELYGELSEEERASVPEVLLRMIDGDASIRPVTRDELPETEAVDAMLEFFASAGLVTRDGEAYELAKPGLIQAWPRLRSWVADNRDGLPVHRRLADAAELWDSNGRKPGDLLHGSPLDRTLQWAASERRDLTLARREREFLDAASQQSRRQSRRRGLLAAALAVLLVAALGGIGLAEYLRRQSSKQRDEALARSLALRASDLRDSAPEAAMVMSAAAWRLADLPESRGALYDSLSQSTIDSFTDPDASAETVYSLSPDGRTLVAVLRGQATLWDVRARRALRRFRVSEEVVEAALSPDGRTLALQDARHVQFWDIRSGKATGPAFATGTDRGHLGDLRFDQAGQRLYVPGGARGTWWDLKTARSLRADAVSPDGRFGLRYSSGSGRAELWDLTRRRRLDAPWLPDGKRIKEAEFAPDGGTLAVTVYRPEARGVGLVLRSVPSGRAVSGDGAGPVNDAIAFSDRFLVLWRDKKLLILRRSDGSELVHRDMHAPVVALRIDGPTLRVATDGGTVYSVDVTHLSDRPTAPGTVEGLARFAPGGGRLALLGGGQARLWDGATQVGRPVAVTDPTGEAATMAFSADGTRLAVGGKMGESARVSVLDTGTGAVLRSFAVARADAVGVSGLAFSPDGDTLAVTPALMGGLDPGLELWNLRTGSLTLPGVPGTSWPAYSPDGKVLVVGFAPDLTLLDPAKGVVVGRRGGVPQGRYAFSPDGKLAAISAETRLTLWDAGFTRTLGSFPAVPGYQGAPPVWSPDGGTIATYGQDERIRLWDVARRQYLGTLYDGLAETGSGSQATLTFARDGRTLYSATPEGVVRRFPLDGERVLSAVCARAGGTLGQDEWRRYLPDVEFFNPCAA